MFDRRKQQIHCVTKTPDHPLSLCHHWNMGYNVVPICDLSRHGNHSIYFGNQNCEDVLWPAWQPFIKLAIRPWSLPLFSWDSSLAAPTLTGRTKRHNWQKAKHLNNASNQVKVKRMNSTVTEMRGNMVGCVVTICTHVILTSQPVNCLIPPRSNGLNFYSRLLLIWIKKKKNVKSVQANHQAR